MNCNDNIRGARLELVSPTTSTIFSTSIKIVNKPFTKWDGRTRKILRSLTVRPASESYMTEALREDKEAIDTFVVFGKEGRILGWALHTPSFHEEPNCLMTYVRRDSRRKGVGRLLVIEAKKKYHKPPRKKLGLFLWDSQSEEFYYSLFLEPRNVY